MHAVMHNYKHSQAVSLESSWNPTPDQGATSAGLGTRPHARNQERVSQQSADLRLEWLGTTPSNYCLALPNPSISVDRDRCLRLTRQLVPDHRRTGASNGPCVPTTPSSPSNSEASQVGKWSALVVVCPQSPACPPVRCRRVQQAVARPVGSLAAQLTGAALPGSGEGFRLDE